MCYSINHLIGYLENLQTPHVHHFLLNLHNAWWNKVPSKHHIISSSSDVPEQLVVFLSWVLSFFFYLIYHCFLNLFITIQSLILQQVQINESLFNIGTISYISNHLLVETTSTTLPFEWESWKLKKHQLLYQVFALCSVVWHCKIFAYDMCYKINFYGKERKTFLNLLKASPNNSNSFILKMDMSCLLLTKMDKDKYCSRNLYFMGSHMVMHIICKD